jgi:hypothetical protein
MMSQSYARVYRSGRLFWVGAFSVRFTSLNFAQVPGIAPANLLAQFRVRYYPRGLEDYCDCRKAT